MTEGNSSLFCNLTRVYSYGFNGKENDNEVKGAGNQQDYGERIYDPRLGKFLSLDPLFKKFAWYTPYQFAGNTPIWAVDLDGLEDVLITDIPHNKGECMEVTYTADDIATIIKGQSPTLRIRYSNSKQPASDQFKGTNKANEMKVFNTIKPLLIKSGITQYMKDDPDHEGRDFEQIYNVYVVPPPPIRRPRISPAPMPPLSVNFVALSDKFVDETQAETIIKPLGDYLVKNPKVNIQLTGNTGLDPGSSGPFGAGLDVTEASSELNGKSATTGELMLARAAAVKDFLVKKYKIDPSRIGTATGTQGTGAAARNVGVTRTN